MPRGGQPSLVGNCVYHTFGVFDAGRQKLEFTGNPGRATVP